MKLQLGMLHLDLHRLAWEEYREAIGCLRSQVAEIRDELIHGPLLMGYRGDRIANEEDFETQPLRYGQYIITFDGRIDNRDEIFAAAGMAPSALVSDPELVVKAHEELGDRVFRLLVGEFAIVLWCDRTKCLRLVRSACGARTLYYTLTKDTLYWASSVRDLLMISGVEARVNDTYVIQYLLSHTSLRESPFTNILPAPPNHIVLFEDGRLKGSNELWDPTTVPPVSYSTDGDYEEHLRSVVRAAVEARMRSKHTIFAELSGGLDSSTIVLMADRILREHGEAPDKLQTVSCIYDQAHTCDERKFIELVEERRGLLTNVVTEEDQEFSTGLEESPAFTGVPNPLHCLPGRYRKIANVMRQHGARVLFSGIGGDHLFWSDPDGSGIIADEIVLGNLLRAHRECKTWSRYTNTPYFELLFDRVLPQVRGSLLGRSSTFLPVRAPVWLTPKHQKQCIIPTSNFEEFRSWKSLPTHRAKVFVTEHLFDCTGAGLINEYKDLYVSHPYSYRPLVEFCLATPVTQFLRNGETRSLMRRAFRDLLPARIANRVSKGLVDESMVRTLEKESGSISLGLNNWRVCQLEYVCPDRLLKSVMEARLGMLDEAGPLFRLFSLERWLRSVGGASQKKDICFSIDVSVSAAAART